MDAKNCAVTFDEKEEQKKHEKNIERNSLSIFVPGKFFQELELHLRLSRDCGDRRSRRDWIACAIREKLDREQKMDIINLPLRRRVDFKIPPELDDTLTHWVSQLKKLNKYLTKSHWIEEAIVEYLHAEKESVIHKVQKLMKETITEKFREESKTVSEKMCDILRENH